MQNILVPTDFSNTAYNALFHATRMMKGIPSTFYILNVYNGFTQLPEKRATNTDLERQWQDRSLEGLQRISHRITLDETDPGHIFETLSKKGHLPDEISKAIDEKEIDLMVMGNSGCSEIKAIFMGSNALDVIDKIKQCPVLTIPKQINFKPPKNIAFVTDYRRPYDAGLLQ